MKTWTEEDWEQRMLEQIARERAKLPPTCPGCGRAITGSWDFWKPRECCKPCALIYCWLDKFGW